MIKFTVAAGRGCFGLLLEDGATTEDAMQLARSPAIRKWLPYPVIVRREDGRGNRRFITSSFNALPDPDKANADETFVVLAENNHTEYSPYKRYGTCTQLIKVMGCAHCDLRGSKCHTTGGALPLLAEGNVSVTINEDEFFSSPPPVVEGFEFIHPSNTKIGPVAARLRPSKEHSFDYVERNKKKASARATAAAETRKNIKDNCAHCLYAVKLANGNYKHCEERHPRTCSGPYANEETQMRAELERGDRRVKNFLEKSELTESQFWALSIHAGIEAVHNRCQVILGGLTYENRSEEFRPVVFRSKSYVHDLNLKLVNYGEIRAIFRELPRFTSDVKRPPDAVRAMWYAVADTQYVRRRAGWGHKTRYLAMRRINDKSITVRLATDRYLYYHGEHLGTLKEVYDEGFSEAPVIWSSDQLLDMQKSVRLARRQELSQQPQLLP